MTRKKVAPECAWYEIDGRESAYVDKEQSFVIGRVWPVGRYWAGQTGMTAVVVLFLFEQAAKDAVERAAKNTDFEPLNIPFELLCSVTPPDDARSPVVAAERTPIEVLGLTVRDQNVLLGAGIDTVQSLVRKTRNELLFIPSMGRRALREIEAALKARGLNLAAGGE